MPVRISPVTFFCFIAFAMDSLFINSLLGDAFFANSVFQANQLQQGILGAVSAALYAAGAFTFGPLSDRVGRRRLALISSFLVVVILLLEPHAPNLGVLIGLTAAKRFICSMFWPAVMAWMADSASPLKFARNLNLFNLSWTVGQVLGTYTAGNLGAAFAAPGAEYNPAAVYYASAAMALVLFLWVLFFAPKPPETPSILSHSVDPSGAKAVAEPAVRVTSPLLKSAWAGHFLLMGATALSMFMLPRLASQPEVHMNEAAQSAVHTVRILVSILAYALMLSTRFWQTRLTPIVGALALAGVGLALIAVTGDAASIYFGAAALGFAGGIAYTASIYHSLTAAGARGKGAAAHETLLGLGNAAGPALGGVAAWAAQSPRAPFWSGAVTLGIAALALGFRRRKS